jgi:hypothetical protein
LSGRTEGAGVSIAVGGRRFFLPVERLAFVAPIRETRGGHLVLERGSLPLLRLAERLGLASRGDERRAVGIDGRRGFYAVAADDVAWLDAGTASSSLETLDPDGLWTAEEEAELFPAT